MDSQHRGGKTRLKLLAWLLSHFPLIKSALLAYLCSAVTVKFSQLFLCFFKSHGLIYSAGFPEKITAFVLSQKAVILKRLHVLSKHLQISAEVSTDQNFYWSSHLLSWLFLQAPKIRTSITVTCKQKGLCWSASHSCLSGLIIKRWCWLEEQERAFIPNFPLQDFFPHSDGI